MKKIIKNIFVSWTTKNKDAIKKYMNEISKLTKLSYYLSDYDCIGNFEDWFKDEINNAPFFLVYITKESLNKEFVKKEVEEIIRKYKKYSYKFITFISDVPSKKINQLDKNHPFYRLINECKVSGVFTSKKDFDEIVEEISEKIKVMTNLYDLLEYSNRLDKELEGLKLLANDSVQPLSNFFTERILLDEIEQQEINYENIINKKKVLIRGEAGSGKTVYVKYLASNLNKTNNVFVLENNEVQDIISQNSSIISYLYKKIKASVLQEDDFKILMKRSKNYLILEGLDEVISKNKIKLLETINQFNDIYDNFNIIFTSRNNEDISDIFKVRLLPLNKEQIQETARKYICFYSNDEDDEQGFYFALSDINEDIKNNPLLLSQLAYVYSRKNILPNNKLDLYDEITSLLITEIDKDVIESNLNDIIQNFIKNNRKILSKCAYNLIINKGNKHYNFLTALSASLENEDEADTIYKYLKARSIINIKDEFYHKTFLEYFASNYIFIKDNNFYEDDDIDGLVPTSKLEKLINKEDVSDLYEMILLRVDSQCGEEGIKQTIEILVNDTTEYFYLLDILKQNSIFAKYLLKPIFNKVVAKEAHPYHDLLYYTAKYDLYIELLSLAKEIDSQELNYIYAFIQDIICLYGDINIKDYENLYIDNIKKIKNDGTKRYQNLIDFYVNGKINVYFYYEYDEYNIYRENNDKLIGHIIVNRQSQLQDKVTKNIIGLSIIDCDNFYEEFDCYYKKTIKYYILPKKLTYLNDIFAGNQIIRIIVMYSEITFISDNAFENTSNLQKITISKNIVTIGDSAFSKCSKLQTIEIPSGVTKIGTLAFSGCSNLKSIEIPSSVTEIGNSAFNDCYWLASIEIPSSVIKIGTDAFRWCNNLSEVYYKGTMEEWCNIDFSSEDSNPMTYAEDLYIFDQNNVWTKVKEIEISESITKIGDYQFNGFDGITNIVIPKNVISIGAFAFYNCYNLKNIYYKGTIEDWCKIKFSNESSNPMYIKSKHVMNENNEYQETKFSSHFYMFDINKGWYKNTTIEIPDAIEKINDYTFQGFCDATNLFLSKNVKNIGSSSFIDCNLTNVYYRGRIEDWCKINLGCSLINCAEHFYILNENNEWHNLKTLENLEIPKSILKIGDLVFSGCSNLKNIKIPSHITEIGEAAFSGCSNLKSIEIPSSVTKIGDAAFSGCSSLSTVVLSKKIKYIGWCAFDDCINIKNVYYEGLLEDWCKVDVTESGANPMRYTKSFYLLDENEEWYDLKDKKKIKISDRIETINEYQFVDLNNLTSLILPESLIMIRYLGFDNCPNLKNIYFLGKAKKWLEINKCFNGDNIYLLNDKNKHCKINEIIEVEIPNSIITLDNQIFDYINLERLIIPISVKKIYLKAFSRLNKKINIYYKGTIEEWCNVKIESVFEKFSVDIKENEIMVENLYVLNQHDEWYEVTNIEIPNTVKCIGDYQFRMFKNLKTVVLPKDIILCGECAFNESVEIYYNGTIEDWCKIDSSKYCKDDTSEIDHSFGRTGPIQIIHIFTNPMSYVEHFYMLNSCNQFSELTDIEIPNTITNIYDDKFTGCTSLASIIIPKSVKRIGDSFAWCENLKKVYYRGTIEDWCKINLYCSLMSYAEQFYILDENNKWYELTEIEIPDTITSINEYQFFGFSHLESIIIPKSVKRIGNSFAWCENLKKVYYRGTIEDWCKINLYCSLMSYAEQFYILDENNKWYELTEIEIPDTITSINENQFFGFSHLESLIIPKSVTYIDEAAFTGCNNIKKLTISENFLFEIENLFTSEFILKKYRNKKYIVKDGIVIFE